MLNPDFSIFDDNMFLQLRAHLTNVAPPADLTELNLTIGEPQMPAPALLVSEIAKHPDGWRSYPKADGDAAFREDVRHYIGYRYGQEIAEAINPDTQIVPVVGTREPLHLLGQMVRGAKENSIALLPNPYYHAWRAGALGAGGDIYFMPTSQQTGFLPDLEALDEDMLRRTSVFYMCSPSNPHGSFASLDYYKKLIEMARHYDFLLLSDECYADIWRGAPPVGALQAAQDLGAGFDHLVVLNSLSKRSNAAGLRAGFLTGDIAAIGLYKKLVANGAALLPTPLLRAAGALYRDAPHAEAIRQHYEVSFQIASDILGITPPAGGFFLWLPVENDLAFVKQAYQEQALRLMPGQFMALTTSEGNPGTGYVRVALVHDHETVTEACHRLAKLTGYRKSEMS